MNIHLNPQSLKMILFIYPFPKGSEENQFAPFRDRGKQIDFIISFVKPLGFKRIFMKNQGGKLI